MEFTLDYQEAHPEFIRLVGIEKIHHGRHVGQSEAIRRLNATAIEMLAAILERGWREGTFRAGADPVDVHMMISALCFFRMSNRCTFGTVFGVDLKAEEPRRRHRCMASEAVLGFLDRGAGEVARDVPALLPRRPGPARRTAPGRA